MKPQSEPGLIEELKTFLETSCIRRKRIKKARLTPADLIYTSKNDNKPEYGFWLRTRKVISMVIEPLAIWEEEEEQKALEKLEAPETIVVRYGFMKQIGEFPYQGNDIPGCGTKMVIKSPRGIEIGEMLTVACSNAGCGSSVSRKQMLEYIENSGGKQYPFSTNGKILRIATIDDLNEQSSLENSKPQYLRTARQHIDELGLSMKIIDIEILLGGDRVIFYFTAEDRIDFRDLVKKLAADCHCRIEMRQVGARDEARLIADYEKCGQQCCCKQFLKVLKPISMKSAKIQKATLDPSKISGRCGRLMCCLRYEDETYSQLRKNLPNRNSTVNTDDGLGRVCSTQILTQLVLVELESNGQRNAYPVEHIERVSKDDIERIRAEQQSGRTSAPSRRRPERDDNRPKDTSTKQSSPQDTKPTEQGRGGHDSSSGQEDQGEGQGKRRRRRRRRKKKSENNQDTQSKQNNNDSNQAEPPRPKPGQPLKDHEVQSKEDAAPSEPKANAEGGSDDNSDQQSGGKRRRRRRRRRKKSSGGGAQNNNSSSED